MGTLSPSNCCLISRMYSRFFPYLFYSIWYTYKVSRKLQNIYHFIKKASKMLQSKDKTICSKEHIHIAGFPVSSLSHLCSSASLSFMILKDLTLLYQEKPEYIILYKAPFYKKKSLHTNPIVFFLFF